MIQWFFFTYYHLIWANCPRTRLNKLYHLQKRAIWWVFMANKFPHAATFFYKLSWLTTFDLYHFQLAAFVYTVINESNAYTFNNYFVRNNIVYSHATRSCLDLHTAYARTCLRASSARVGLGDRRYWNTLLHYTRHWQSAILFKKYLKIHLLSSYN